MLAQFKQFISTQQLFSPNETVLVAFSGGIDSVSLVHLLFMGGYRFALAHGNFGLRGADSDADQAFAQAIAAQYGVAFFTIKFDVQGYMAQHAGASIQMAARELRYEWLEQVRKDNQFSCIATAHHQNDMVETMLYNLTMGTGISGLHGILPRRGALVRPLLFCDKAQIVQFAQAQQLAHREDASNAETKYVRNKIRHGVVPVLQAINPRLAQTFYENAQRFADTELIYQHGLQHYHRQICTHNRHETLISIARLQNLAAKKTLLFELLRNYGFNITQVEQILAGLAQGGEAGKLYLSPTHQLLRDRKHLILSEHQATDTSYTLINPDTRSIDKGEWQLQLQSYAIQPDFVPTTDALVACLDSSKLAFPLMLRRFKAGDYFYPIGMGMKKKKISRFFSDLKLSKNEKERTWIVEDQRERIVWVLGHRIDERFKITQQTQTVWEMRKNVGE
jgi:tRNA(Ile)-lysidine synthase